jgi:hypothetical protein
MELHHVFIIHLMKNKKIPKILFNFNISYNTNLVQCVSIPREIDVQITNNMYLLIDFSYGTKICLKFHNLALFINVNF